MKWFRRKRDDECKKLQLEINAAQEQYARAVAAQEHVDEIKKETEAHMSQNRFGDRLFAEMIRTRRRRPA